MAESSVIFVFRDGDLVDVHYNVDEYNKALSKIQAYLDKRLKYVTEAISSETASATGE